MRSQMCTLLALIFVSLHGSAQKIGIQPSILEFHSTPGITESQVIRITNMSDTKVGFQAYLADWLRDSSGGHIYYRPDTLNRSCASWISTDKNFIEVAPGKSEDLLVRLQAPANAELFNKMRWAMLFLQSAEEQDSTSRTNKQFNTKIKELLRVGVHIYQTPPTVTHTSAKAVSLKPVVGDAHAYDFYMVNTGETMLQCKAHLALTHIETGKEYKLDKVEFPVFPEGKRTVRLTIPATVPKGKYSALAILDIGEDAALEAIERTIEVQ
ncbi:hypothetical protein [Longitalea arenae]|uniref:hypothetical protein n=1 Tax=Longitalea arenae TaxID=2812558 RepID=UPI001968128C|nr:hypothetical protein [Longitalea arenae]